MEHDFAFMDPPSGFIRLDLRDIEMPPDKDGCPTHGETLWVRPSEIVEITEHCGHYRRGQKRCFTRLRLRNHETPIELIEDAAWLREELERCEARQQCSPR